MSAREKLLILIKQYLKRNQIFVLAFAFKSSNFLSWSKHWYNLINNLVLNNSAPRSFIKINLNFHVNKRQCERQTFFFFLFFYICLNSFRIMNNSFILHFSSSSFYNIIEFIFSQVQMLTFRFDFLKTNLIVASKVRFIFFLTSTCSFIAIKDKKKNDDENALSDYFNWKVFSIIWKRSSTAIFRDDNIFFFAKSDFNFSCKTFFVCFSMIFEIDCDDKLRKRTTNWTNFEKINQTIRKDDVNVLKTFINDFLSDIVIFLSNNEVERIFKFNTYSFSKKTIFETFSINRLFFRLNSTFFNFDEINVVWFL